MNRSSTDESQSSELSNAGKTIKFIRRPKVAIPVAGLFALTAIYLVYAAPWLSWIDWPKTFESIAHLSQAIGLAFGGWWTFRLFVKQRIDRIRANVEHYVSSAELNPEERVIRVLLEIQNVGSVLLRPPKAFVRLDLVAPASTPDLSRLKGSLKTAEHNWPMVGEIRIDLAADGFQLEPLEKERYAVDFLVPIATSAVQVFSRVDAPDGTCWTLATLHEIQK